MHSQNTDFGGGQGGQSKVSYIAVLSAACDPKSEPEQSRPPSGIGAGVALARRPEGPPNKRKGGRDPQMTRNPRPGSQPATRVEEATRQPRQMDPGERKEKERTRTRQCDAVLKTPRKPMGGAVPHLTNSKVVQLTNLLRRLALHKSYENNTLQPASHSRPAIDLRGLYKHARSVLFVGRHCTVFYATLCAESAMALWRCAEFSTQLYVPSRQWLCGAVPSRQ